MIARRFKDLLYRRAPYFVTDAMVAARDGCGPVTSQLDTLDFETGLLYACLWYANNLGIEVHVRPSRPLQAPSKEIRQRDKSQRAQHVAQAGNELLRLDSDFLTNAQ